MSSHTETDYRVTVDATTVDRWHDLLARFDDASVHQTWSYGAIRWGQRSLSHLVLERDGKPVGAAQVVIKAAPGLGIGLANVRFGPLWQPNDREPDLDDLAALLDALRVEYAERRGYALRLKPWLPTTEAAEAVEPVLLASGFARNPDRPAYKTFVLDLSTDLQAIHDGMERKWRRDLRRARERGLTAELVDGVAAIDAMVDLYHSMQARKGFADLTDLDDLRRHYLDLPTELRHRVMLCHHEGEVVSGIVFTDLGERAFALFGASTTRGLELGASYVVNWRVVETLAMEGRVRWYDLVGGLSNPGIRHFKAGLAKGCGAEVHLADYEAPGRAASKLLLGLGDRARASYRSTRKRIGR